MFANILNIDSKTLNCVLIGFIIAILVIIVVNYVQKKNAKECLVDTDFDNIKNKVPKCGVQVPVEKKQVKTKLEKPQRFCEPNEIEDLDTRLARDIVIGRQLQQEIPQEEFTRDEVDAYLSDNLDFNEKINHSSQNRCDMVEQIGEDRLQNSELTKNQGKTIGEIFDGYMKDETDKIKKCKNTGCVVPGGYDDVMKRQVYKDTNETYANFHTRYETDGVNNGGKFFDSIEGHDVESLSYMSY